MLGMIEGDLVEDQRRDGLMIKWMVWLFSAGGGSAD